MKEIRISDYSMLQKFVKDNFPTVNIPLEECEKADFILGDTFYPEIERFNGVRILQTGENHPVDLNRFDYCLTHELVENDRCHRYPYWQYHCLRSPLFREQLLAPRQITADELIAEQRDFCAFVCRNPKGKERNNLVRELMKHRKVSCGGPFMNNIGYILPRPYEVKQEFQHKHYFSIAYENESSPGYQTEKIVDAFLSKSIPIYWGNPRVTEEFNPKAFVNAHDFKSTKALVQYVLELAESPRDMAEMLSQPVLQDSEVFEKSDKQLKDFLSRIFERGPGAIQRTPLQRFLGTASRYYGHGLFRTLRFTLRKIKGKR